MATHRHEMLIPTAVVSDRDAFEIARIWIGQGKQHVSLSPNTWDDPTAWGLMLVDIARHVADAYEQTGRMKRATALDRIKRGFDAEWNSPTDVPSGSLLS